MMENIQYTHILRLVILYDIQVTVLLLSELGCVE